MRYRAPYSTNNMETFVFVFVLLEIVRHLYLPITVLILCSIIVFVSISKFVFVFVLLEIVHHLYCRSLFCICMNGKICIVFVLLEIVHHLYLPITVLESCRTIGSVCVFVSTLLHILTILLKNTTCQDGCVDDEYCC